MLPRRTGAGRVVTLAAVLAVLPAIQASPPAPDSLEQSTRLAHESDLLRRKIELASSKSFYLLLDSAAQRLALMYRGALLREFPVVRIEVGSPRVVFMARSLPAGWDDKTWKSGALDPPRPERREEITPTRPGEEPHVVIPPTPEEAYPAPPRYLMRFDGGLTIEVLAEGSTEGPRPGRLAALIETLRDKATAFGLGNDDTLRIRVTLTADEAAALYRALPPEFSLLLWTP